MTEGVKVGDLVSRRATGEVGVVVRLGEGGMCDVSLPSGLATIPVEDLKLVPRDPVERLVGQRQVGRVRAYDLRLQSLYLKHAYRYDPKSGLSNARIEPQLHQIYVAHRVTNKLRPRMILADEVGLGKTIEAALILKELRARQLIDRVLVVCPANLQRQWEYELRSKFNEEFTIYDGATTRLFATDGGNPWAKSDNIICSLPFACRHPEQIVDAGWDLVIFDEAHRVRRWLRGQSDISTTQAYRLADDLKEVVNGLLLLTATPMQLSPFELFSLIELVEPGLYPTYESYQRQRTRLPVLNDLMKLLRGWNALSEREQEQAAARHRPLLKELQVAEPAVATLASDENRIATMDRLASKHPLAEALVRNRKSEIGGFTSREASRVLVELTLAEYELYADISEYLRNGYNKARSANNAIAGFAMVVYQKMLASSSHAIQVSFGRRIAKLQRQLTEVMQNREPSLQAEEVEELEEQEELSTALQEVEGSSAELALQEEVRALEQLVQRLSRTQDSKLAELLKAVTVILSSHPDEKIVIFTQFVETQNLLAERLGKLGFRISTFNGQMSLDEKERAVQRFRETGQILVSTEAGGEGRNFQFAHIMVNYDLPWNPMKVEQRIGRLDRIGQRKTVYIYNLACLDTIEERVLDVLERRIGLFQESVGSLDPILGNVERDIEKIVMTQVKSYDDAFVEYELEIEERVRRASEVEKTLGDFALDRASLRQDVANELLKARPLATHRDLESFVADALEYFGGTLQDHAEGGQVIALSPRLATDLKSRQSTVRGAFNPDSALRLEGLDFFAFGHELIDRIVELPLKKEEASTAFRQTAGPPGVWIEIFYEIYGVGLRPSARIVRHLVNESLEVRLEDVQTLPAGGEPCSDASVPDWAEGAVGASRKLLEEQVARAAEGIRAENEQVKRAERVRADRIFKYQQIRLTNLIDEEQRWIRETESHGSSDERRILPARKGKLAKNRDRLQRLEFEHQTRLEEIDAREPGIGAKVLAAGVLINS